MRIAIIALLIVTLLGCQKHINQKNTTTNNSKSISLTEPSSKTNIEYPLFVEYTNDVNSDSMFFYLKSDKLLVTPKGRIFKNNELFIDIHPEGNIQKLFPLLVGDDLVIIYSFSTVDGESGSFAKRISLKQKSIIWETLIYGFNLVRPVFVGDYVYLSTIGFVAKLNVVSGKFIWKFDDFFKNGKFISFNEPLFFKNGTVLFTERNIPVMISSSILIDDINGRVLKSKK